MKTGLVLEGGGAKGAFHCGAIRALYDNGYRFDGAVGTSIGAINAALVVQDSGPEHLTEMWSNIAPSMLFDVDDREVEKYFDKEMSGPTVKYWLKQVVKVIKNLGIPVDKALEFLQKHISEEKVRESSMDFGMVTYSLSDREPVELYKEDIPQGGLLNYILASAYYPAFKLQRIDGKFFIDGGIYDNMPIALLEKKGYESIIAVRTMSKMPHSESTKLSTKIDYICPSEDLGRTMQVTTKMINRNIKLGYYDALRFINGYLGKRYYIAGLIEEITDIMQSNSCFDFSESFYNELKAVYPQYSEKDIPIAYLEELARFYGIKKFNIYKPKEFVDEILRNADDLSYFCKNKFHRVLKENAQKEIFE